MQVIVKYYITSTLKWFATCTWTKQEQLPGSTGMEVSAQVCILYVDG